VDDSISPDTSEEVESNKSDSSGKYELNKALEDGAKIHIEELNELVLEQKSAKSRVKKNYIQNKINNKKDIIYQYIAQLAKLKET
jgi:sulfite reductase alpha subunit-like flavoprotein